ncbi:MAG: peptidylprolyl isomerase [candidate division Zixibacteria bacterium]|nr:peptidylprolyl isomerase [candidate division Zixibacteria bacterium]
MPSYQITRRLLICALSAILTAPVAYAQEKRETIDRIIAVVGDEAILASELASQLQLYTLQTGEQPKTEREFERLRDDILDQMITDRLFLFEARKDTSITVRDEEVDQALDDHVARIAGNFATNDEFLSALAAEGLTVRDLRKKYRPDVRNQMLKQRFIQKKLYSVSVSKHEVESFYGQFKDSLPSQPEGVKLAHILLTVESSQPIEDSVRELATALRQQVLDGADLATLSTRYSSMGAGENGGDLGYVARDEVVPEFARAAFILNVGDVSGVIRTQFGYHVIQCEGRREDRLKLRHILLAVVPSATDTTRAYHLADSLLQEARAGADFGELAKAYSRDDETRAQGGELGWFATAQLPPEFSGAVSGWKTPGEYRGPVVTPFGLHLLKLLDYQEHRQYSLDDDFDKIKELARQDKTGRVVDEWIQQVKERTYIQYRLES